MVSAQRQFFGDVFAIGSSVEGELEVAGLADQKAVRREDSSVGVCDGKAEFAGAILCAERGDKQEKEGGIDQGDLDQNTAQTDSPRSAGRPWDILQRRRAEAVGRKRYCFRAGEASRIDPRFDAACVGTAAPGCPSRAQLVLVSSAIAIPECPHPNGQQSTGIRGGDGGHGFLWRF